MRRALFLIAFCLPFAVLESATAQDASTSCDAPPIARRPIEFFPASGARSVSLDAPLRVRYSPGFFDEFSGEPPTLLDVRTPLGSLPGSIQVLGDELVYFPTGGWAPGTVIQVAARGIEGDASFSFTTGTRRDTMPPTWPSAAPAFSAMRDTRCSDTRFRVFVQVPQASDDGPLSDVEYLLFLTRARGLVSPSLRARARGFASTEPVPMAFTISTTEASAPICIAVVAVDGLGKTVASPTVCKDPIQGVFFDPLCTASPWNRGAPPMSNWVWIGLISATLFIRRPQRRKALSTLFRKRLAQSQLG